MGVFVLVLALWTPTKPHELAEDTPWHVLLQTHFDAQARPVYPDTLVTLDGQDIRLSGFMMPIESGTIQRHFLLMAYPPSCSFCVSGGPSSTIEVYSEGGVAYSRDAVTVTGTLRLLPDAPDGMFFRLDDARPGL